MLVQGVIDMSMSFDFGVQLLWIQCCRYVVVQTCSCGEMQYCRYAVVLACSCLGMQLLGHAVVLARSYAGV